VSRRKKRVLLAVLIPLGLLLLLVLGAWLYITSSAGSELIRTKVVGLINDDLKGKVEVESLTTHGGLIVIDGLKLYTPEGELVVEIKHAELDPQLMALAQRRIVLRSAKVEEPRFYLKTDERGLNLNRAIESKLPAVGPVQQLKLYVDIGKVQISEGYFDFTFGEQSYTLQQIHVDGKATVSLPTLSLVGDLHAGSHVTSPIVDVLDLDVTALTGKPGDVTMDLKARTSDTHVNGTLKLDPVKLVITDSVASPITIRAFAPQFKIKVPVSTTGTLTAYDFDVKASAGSARVAAKASFPKGGLLDAVELHASDVDLSELLEGGRPSHLSADLTGKLNDVTLDAFDGEVKGQARWEEEGKPVATADLDVVAVKGQLTVNKLDAKVPGARLNVKGKGDRESLSIHGTLDLNDLKRVSQTLSDFTGIDPLPLSGQGSLKLSTAGPLLHPGVKVSGGFKALRYDNIGLTDFKIDAAVADVTKPLEAKAQLSVAKLEVGTTVIEGISAETSTKGRALTARFSTKSLSSLSLSTLVEATLDADNRGLLLTTLTTDWPGQQWVLERPAHIGWTADGDFETDAIGVRSELQRFIVAASLKGKVLDASAQVQLLDLAALPKPLIPPVLKLKGLASAKVRAFGPTDKLQADVDLQWVMGTLFGLGGITFVGTLHYAEERVQGGFTVDTSLGQATGDYALPITRKVGKPQPVLLRFTTSALELSQAAASFGGTVPLDGAVMTSVDIEGTLEQPLPKIHAETAALRVCDGPCAPKGKVLGDTTKIVFDRVELNLTADAEQKPDLSLDITALGGLTRTTLRIPFTYKQLLDAYLPATPKSGPTPKAKGINWLLTPMEVAVESNGIDLLKVGPVVQLSEPLKGKLTVVARGTGTLTHPDLSATVGVIGLQADGKQPLDATATLVTNRDDSRLTLEVRRLAKKVLTLTGRMGAPIELVRNEAGLMETPLMADAEVGPVAMADLFVPEDEGELPTGTMRATMSVKGTAAAPRGSLRGSLENVKIGSASLGQAGITWDYEARKHTFSTALTSGGRLKASGTLDLDISVPAIRKGLQVATAPVSATVTANDFDVAFFSGATPMVRTLAGLLKLDVKVQGELFGPAIDGKMEWTKGRIGIAGFGDYRDVHLLATGNNAGYVLQELTANAGGGNLSMTAKAKRDSPGNFTLSASTELNNFPIVTDDQLLAIATARATLKGTANARLVDIQRLAIPEAHIDLPDVKRKDLQSLDRPDDIILVRNGIPLKKRKKKPDAAARQASLEKQSRFQVLIDAPRNLWVTSSDVNLELGLSDRFRIEYTDRVLIYGEANVIRGRVDVIGRRFDIQKNSQVRFSGIPTEPYLSVTAIHVNEREGVTVYVNVVGKGKEASLKLSSQPPIPDSELLILLTTGRRTLKQGGGSSVSGADAASILGSVVASQLKTLVAKRLPLDVLSIESGEAGIQDARVEAGVYLSDKAYIGLQLDLGADRTKGENAYAAKFEYQLSKSWGVEATAGDAPAVGAELLWSRDF